MTAPDEPPHPSPSEGLWSPPLRGLTSGLVLSTTLVAAEALAAITIMPSVARELGGLRLYGWVFASFMLASLIGAVAAGRLSDDIDPARALLAGLALFAAGLVVAGLAPSMPVLLTGRVLQGLGAGAVEAISYVAVGRLPAHLRARMFAVLSSAWVLPGLLGPAVSAGVAGLFGWRWVFIGLLAPIAVAGLLAVPALARLAPSTVRAVNKQRIGDAVAVAVGGGLLIGGLGSHEGPTAIALVLAGLGIGVLALGRLMPAGTLLARPGLPAVILTRGLLTFAFFGADAFVTLTITTVLRHSSVIASLAITASTVAWSAGSWLQVRLSGGWEGRRLVSTGLALILVGIGGLLVSLRAGVPVGEAVAAWALAGLGMGLAYTPTSLMTLREASPGREGWASASLNLSDVLGSALGAGVGGAAIVTGADRGWPMSTSVAVAFVIAGIAAVMALALTQRLPLLPIVDTAREAQAPG